MPDTDTTSSPPPAPPGIDINQLLASLLGNAPVAPPPQVQNVNLAATRPTSLGGILGEALAGGPPTDVPLTAAQRDAAGRRALLSASIGMMNVGPFASIGQGIGAGLSGAMASQAYSEAVEAERQTAAQDWQTKQQALQLERLKEAIPLLRMQAAAGIPNPLLGGNAPPGAVPPTASVGATSNAADFTSKFTPIAQTIATKTGLPLSYVLSQAGLETGWGSSPAARNNNFFGMTDPATGKLMSFATPEEGANAYIALMASDRYKGVPRTGTPQQIGDAMALAGYNPNVPKKDSTDSYGARIGNFAASLPKPGTTVAAAGPPGASTGPAAAPRPYQVASAGPTPPPPSGAPTTLPVPPVPPAGGIPIPGGQGLVLKPDGTIGTPGGGFKGTPVASTAPPPATTTPTEPPAPQAATQQPPQPPAVVPPGQPDNRPDSDLTFAEFRARHGWEPSAAERATFTVPQDAEAIARAQAELAAAAQSRGLALRGLGGDVNKAQSDYQTASNNLAQLQQQLTIKNAEAERDWRGKQDALLSQQYVAAKESANKIKEINAQSDATASTKALQDINESQQGAQNTLALLGLARQLSAVSGTASFDQLWPNLANNMARAGLLSPEEIQQIGAQRSFDAVMNKLVLAARQGTGMSRISNMDLQFLQNTAPTSFTPEQIRTPMLAALETVYQRQLQYAHMVNAMHGSGMPVWQAEQEADKQLGSVLKQPPAMSDPNSKDYIADPNARLDAQGKWVNQNVPMGSFYLKPDGTLAIRGAPKQPQSGQQ